MRSAFKFRLYPDEKQSGKLLGILEAGRRLWNDALAHRKRRWEVERKSTSYSYQCWVLTAERNADPSLGEMYSQMGQDMLKRLDKAFKAFFERRTHYPRFKKYGSANSVTYPQAYNGCVRLDTSRKRLFLSKVGNVRVVIHRPVPAGTKLKTCTVRLESDGSWYASLVYEDEAQIPKPVKTLTSPVGIDLGLKSLVMTSEGIGVPHPKFLRKAEKRLKRLQRRFSSKAKGSAKGRRTRRLLAIQHARVARRRRDFNHKLTTELVRKHDLVAFEDLKVRNMVRNHALAKSISDAGWGQLVTFCQYKEEWKGGLVIKVEPAYTTQECFFCGALNDIPLSIRQFECLGCGRTLDRDTNAAKIILKRAIAKVPRDTGELTPVETGPIPLQTTGVASLVEEAGTIRGGVHSQPLEPAAGSLRLRSGEDVTQGSKTINTPTRRGITTGRKWGTRGARPSRE